MLRAVQATAILAASAALSAAADPPPIYRFVLDDLTSFEAELIDLDTRTLRYDTGDGMTRSLDAARLLGMEFVGADDDTREATPAWATGIRTRPGLVRLVDGRRYTGAPSTSRNDDETLLWDHALLGRLEIPLELIDRVQQPRTFIGTGLPGTIERTPESDRIRLINGDRLEGFLVEAGTVFAVETDAGEIEVQQGDIDQYALANPAEPLEGPVLWLAEGSVIAAPSLRVTGGLIEFGPAGSTETEAEAPLSEERVASGSLLDADGMLAYVPDASRLVPLAALPESAPHTEESVATQPFNAWPLVWSSPGETTFALPEGASWFTTEIILPIEARAWGDATLVVLGDRDELARVGLDARTPSATVRVPLAGRRTLTVRLEPGDYGSVQVEARLDGALIAVD